MSDELPAAAVRAGAETLRQLWDDPGDDQQAHTAWEYDARAVLVAATERIECPRCDEHGRVLGEVCPVCAGTGFLYVLKQSESE